MAVAGGVAGASPLRIEVARSLDEVRLILDWAAAEGWNPGLSDAEAFLAADPEGFLLGRLGSSPWPRSPWCDMTIASRPRLLHRHAGAPGPGTRHRDVARGGRACRGADHRPRRRAGPAGGLPALRLRARAAEPALQRAGARPVKEVPRTGEPVDASRVPFEALARYDRGIFPADRRTFLARWIVAEGHHGVAWLDGDVPRGYGVVRPCRSGWKIGPLFADDATIAGAIFGALAGRIGGDPRLHRRPRDEPGRGRDRRAGRVCGDFETARMYAGPPPGEDRGRVYGVTTFELG